MDVLVCIKRVPLSGGKFTITDDGRDIETAKLGFTISPHEEVAVEEAVRIVEQHGSGSVTVLTLGQYLRPTPKHLPVVEYIAPEVFDEYKSIALEKGFRHVASGPLVRSSYHAAEFRPELDVLEAIEADLRAAKGLELGPEHLPLPEIKAELNRAIA